MNLLSAPKPASYSGWELTINFRGRCSGLETVDLGVKVTVFLNKKKNSFELEYLILAIFKCFRMLKCFAVHVLIPSRKVDWIHTFLLFPGYINWFPILGDSSATNFLLSLHPSLELLLWSGPHQLFPEGGRDVVLELFFSLFFVLWSRQPLMLSYTE